MKYLERNFEEFDEYQMFFKRSNGVVCGSESTCGLRSVIISFIKRSVGKLKVVIMVTAGGVLLEGAMRVIDGSVEGLLVFEERGTNLYCLLKRNVENLPMVYINSESVYLF